MQSSAINENVGKQNKDADSNSYPTLGEPIFHGQCFNQLGYKNSSHSASFFDFISTYIVECPGVVVAIFLTCSAPKNSNVFITLAGK